MPKLRNVSLYLAVPMLWVVELVILLYIRSLNGALELGVLALYLPLFGIMMAEAVMAAVWLVFGQGSLATRILLVGIRGGLTLLLAPIDPDFASSSIET